MPKAKTMMPGSPAALLKLERERDKAQATLDYQANQAARNKNMQRLRALRLAREAVCAQSTQKPSKVVSILARPRRKSSL
jgi:hypothetical protein